MNRSELIKAIKVSGATPKRGASLEDLESMYNSITPSDDIKNLPDEPAPDIYKQETELSEEDTEKLKEEVTSVKQNEEEQKEEKPKNAFDELLGKIENADIPHSKEKVEKPLIEKTKRKRKKGESSPDSFRIEGYVLLLVTDTIFPFGLAFLNNILDKKIKVDATDLQLNEKDFNKLEPIADQAADFMAVNLNPIAGFFLVATFMYSNNLIALRMSKSENKIV